jgi:hypothetical protein
MTAIIKVKYSKDFEAYDYHIKPFNYYILHLVYEKNDSEILKTFTFYEDEQIEKIINGNQNILLYKYPINYFPNKEYLYFITIKVEDEIFNFKVEGNNRWVSNFYL